MNLRRVKFLYNQIEDIIIESVDESYAILFKFIYRKIGKLDLDYLIRRRYLLLKREKGTNNIAPVSKGAKFDNSFAFG